MGEENMGQLCYRLEHNTSGVQIYAKTKEALAEFRHQRQEGKVLVEYVALVEGSVGIDEPGEGAVEVPLLPWQDANRRDLGSVWCAKDGLPSCTSYKVLDRYEVPATGPVSFWARSRWFSLLHIKTHSDRMYQVYAHMAFIGHPVSCEQKYNGLNFEEDSALLPRSFLHVVRVETPALSASCDLAPDLQVALLRLQSLALDTEVCQSWTTRLPGLVSLMACRGTRPAAPEDGQDLPTNQQAQQISRCCCTGEFVEAKCQVVSDGPRRALHWTLHPSMTEEVGHNSSETWPSRLWAFEVKSWIPFELRGRNHEDWRWQSDSAGIDALPEPWKRHGQRWSWAHDGNRVNGWIEFGDAGRLTSKWGAGFWHPVGDDQFLVVGMNSMAHLLRLTEDTFEVISKRPAVAGETWSREGTPCCATRGWPERCRAVNKNTGWLRRVDHPSSIHPVG